MNLDQEPLIAWAAAQPAARTWRAAGAVAVACPDLSRRNRLAVHGDADAVVALLGEVLPEVGPSYRPLGDEDLITEVAGRVPGLAKVGRFAWMDVTAPVTGPAAGAWTDDLDDVTGLLSEAFPESYAWPGGSGVRRWAGLWDHDGALVATAADAWSVPEIGFVAGVATHPRARGRGLAAALCAFVTNELLRDRQRVALFADHWNEAAVRTYRRLGFTLRPLGAAARTP
jgi:GNAT superfamily N-acetyltransferase